MLSIKNLTVSYHRIPAIHHITLDLPRGHCVGLFGPNGAGKSTLLKAIARLVPCESGQIILEGELVKTAAKGAATLIAYMPQREKVDWDFPITVEGLVEMGRYHHLGLFRSFGPTDNQVVAEALRMFDLEAFAHRQIKALSGGQQQRAFLARAWAQEADLYLLDEPFTGLDRNATEALEQALRLLKEKGKLIVASHHQLGDASRLFDLGILINGELIAYGSLDEVLSETNLHCAYGTRIFAGIQP